MIDVRRDRVRIGIGQLLLVVAAGELWTASRLPWVVIRSFDGLGPPKETTLSGAAWSTALLPVALLMLAAAVAAVAVRGWPLRVLSVLLAAAGFVVGYLGVSLWCFRTWRCVGQTSPRFRWRCWWAVDGVTGELGSR